MTDEELDELRELAQACAHTVRADFNRDLDFSLASLGVLDLVCHELRETGWHDEDQAEQWWQFVGAYFGEVLVRERHGTWVDVQSDEGPYAVEVGGSTAFPFEAAAQVLTGSSAGSSLAAFGREAAP